jgi:hypothetical protein
MKGEQVEDKKYFNRSHLFEVITETSWFYLITAVCPLNNFHPSFRLIKTPVSTNEILDVLPVVSVIVECNRAV